MKKMNGKKTNEKELQLQKLKKRKKKGFYRKVSLLKQVMQREREESQSEQKNEKNILFIATGGIVTFVIIPLILIIGLIYNSPLAVLFPPLEDGETVMSVANQYVNEFHNRVERLADVHEGYDEGEIIYRDYEGMNPRKANLYDIVAVYMVKYGNGHVATIMDDIAKERIRDIVNQMCSFTRRARIRVELDEDGKEHEVRIMQIEVKLRNYQDMIGFYDFSEEEIQALNDLMSPQGLAMLTYWNTGIEITSKSLLTEEEIREILKDIEDPVRRTACAFALSKVGYPYSQKYRDSGDYYDCSSLAYYSWKAAGVDISYQGMTTAAAEAEGLEKKGQTVSFEEMQPGDLIFYSFTTNGRYKNISHVAIYVGDGMVVEAKNEEEGVVYGVTSKSYKIMIGDVGKQEGEN